MKGMRTLVVFLFFTLAPGTILLADNQYIKKDSIRAEQLFLSGRNLYSEGKYRESQDSLKLSLKIYKKIYEDSNEEVIKVQNALGVIYKNMGQYDKALDKYKLIEKAYLKNLEENSPRFAGLYRNLGNVYKAQLNYQTALEYFQRAAEIYLNQNDIDSIRLADTYYSIAEALFRLNEYQESLEVIEQNFNIADDIATLDFLSLRAAIYQVLNRYEDAEVEYNKVIDLASKIYSNKSMNVAFQYLNYATLLVSAGKIKKASEILEKAYNIIKLNEPREGINIAEYYFIQGNLYANKKVESNDINVFRRQKSSNLHKAIDYYLKSLKALNFDIKVPSDTIPDANTSLSLIQCLDNLKLIADTYVKIAEVYENNRNSNFSDALMNALDYYKVTAGIIQNARKEISSEESKIQLTELEQATFRKMIQTAYKAYENNKDEKIVEFAFKNAERIKASSVFDRLSDELAKNNSLIPDSLLEREKALNNNITQQNERIYSMRNEKEPDSLRIETASAELFQLKKERQELNQYLEENYPNFYNLKYTDLLFGVKEIQQKLKKNEVLIEYVLNDNDSTPELYTFFISPNHYRFIKPEIDTSFINSIENAFRFMSNPRYMFTKSEDSKQFCVDSKNLYNKLILPLNKEIIDKKIIVVPDGKLSYLAFDALLENLPDTSKTIYFNRLDYLIKKNSIDYSYSANLLYKFKSHSNKTRNKLLAFAPEYSPTDTFTFENQKLMLVSLPGVQKEVDLISKEIKTKLFKGKDASEINFRKYSKNYDILHLAMHAFINDSEPAFSKLAFAQNTSNETENNGWLNTADIYNLDLNARLTVLSACNTGSGKLRKGEGVMSLARGFLYAGCPSIVMTLWEVEDNAGTQIMSAFYKNLKKGRAVDEALRLSKLEYLENANPRTAHPHYWLGYVSIGDDTPLFRSYDYYFFGFLIVTLIGITIDQLIRAAKARKKRTEQD